MKEVADIQEPFAAWLRDRKIYFIRHRPDKRSGIRVGHPDFTILHMGRNLCIECKTDEGELSIKQAECIRDLRFNGNTVVICRSLQECIDAMTLIGVTDLHAPEIARQERTGAVSMERGHELASKMVEDVKANVARSDGKRTPKLKQPKQPELPVNGKREVRPGLRPKFAIARIGNKDWVLAPNLEGNWDRIREATPADVINLPKYAA